MQSEHDGGAVGEEQGRGVHPARLRVPAPVGNQLAPSQAVHMLSPLRHKRVVARVNHVVPVLKYIKRLAVQEGRKEMFYLTTHSTHFIYGYMASDM